MTKAKTTGLSAEHFATAKKKTPAAGHSGDHQGASLLPAYAGVFAGEEIADPRAVTLTTILQHQELLKLAATRANLGYFIVDKNSLHIKWSLPLLEIFEVDPADPILQTGHVQDCIDAEDMPMVKQAFIDAISGNCRSITYRIHTRSGKTKVLQTSYSAVDNLLHNQVFGLTRDITAEHQLQAAVAERDRDLASIAEAGSVCIVKTAPNGTILQINGQPAKAPAATIQQIFHPESLAELTWKTALAMETGETVHFEGSAKLPKQKTGWYRVTARKMHDETNEPMMIYFLQDATEVKTVEKKIFHAITESEERERHRIAAELHDGVGQNLAAIALALSAIEKHLDQLPDAKEMATRAKKMLTNTIHLTRRVSHDLMPSELHNLGFIEAVTSLIESLNQTDCIEYALQVTGKVEELAPNLAINIYRIIQEFIRNSQKHSGASRVGIDIRFKGKTLEIAIADNGQGFDPRSLPRNKGIGLFNMINRIKTFNGTYRYRSAGGKGVQLTLSLPLESIR